MHVIYAHQQLSPGSWCNPIPPYRAWGDAIVRQVGGSDIAAQAKEASEQDEEAGEGRHFERGDWLSTDILGSSLVLSQTHGWSFGRVVVVVGIGAHRGSTRVDRSQGILRTAGSVMMCIIQMLEGRRKQVGGNHLAGIFPRTSDAPTGCHFRPANGEAKTSWLGPGLRAGGDCGFSSWELSALRRSLQLGGPGHARPMVVRGIWSGRARSLCVCGGCG